MKTLEQRFWEKVKIGNSDECWEWQAVKNQDGYGLIRRNPIRKESAHRVAWEIANGVIPKGLEVLHSCDNPSCCNANHLFLGTKSDNMRDKETKGRGNHAIGERNRHAKLSRDDVLEIRKLAKSGITQQELANRFKVNQRTISAIITKVNWNWLEE